VPVNAGRIDLDSIKDKVDAIATRICHFKDTDSADDDEELWQKFRDELIKDGFSEDVLRQNQVCSSAMHALGGLLCWTDWFRNRMCFAHTSASWMSRR